MVTRQCAFWSHYTLTKSSTDPVESGISSLGSRRKRHQSGWLFLYWVFFFSCVSPIKSKMGEGPYIFTGMKRLKIIALERRIMKRSIHFFARYWTTIYLPEYSRRNTIVWSNVIQSKITIVADGSKLMKSQMFIVTRRIITRYVWLTLGDILPSKVTWGIPVRLFVSRPRSQKSVRSIVHLREWWRQI